MKISNVLEIARAQTPDARHQVEVTCTVFSGILAAGIGIAFLEGARPQTIHYACLVVAGLIDLIGLSNWNNVTEEIESESMM